MSDYKVIRCIGPCCENQGYIDAQQARIEALEKAVKDVVDTMRGSGGINPKAAEALLNLAALLEDKQ